MKYLIIVLLGIIQLTANLTLNADSSNEPKVDYDYYTVKLVVVSNVITGVASSDIKSFYLPFPETTPYQEIYQTAFFPAPIEIIKELTGQKLALMNSQRACFIVNVGLPKFSLNRADYVPQQLKNNEAEAMSSYLGSNTMILPKDTKLKEIAEKEVGPDDSPYDKALKLFCFIGNHLTYKLDKRWDNARIVFDRGSGSCTEHTFLYMSLCRAVGVYCRYARGTMLKGSDTKWIDYAFHRWVEIYLPGLGWFPVDPTKAKIGPRSFSQKPNVYLTTYQSGSGESQYLGWRYISSLKGVPVRAVWYRLDPKIGSILQEKEAGKKDKPLENLIILFRKLIKADPCTPSALPVIIKLLDNSKELPPEVWKDIISYLQNSSDYEAIPLLIRILALVDSKSKEQVSQILAMKMGIKQTRLQVIGTNSNAWQAEWLKQMLSIDKDFIAK